MGKYLDQAGLAFYDSKMKERLDLKADKSEIPTKTSDLVNDAGFVTADNMPEGATASNTTPKMDGTAAVGTEIAFARGDHVHPTDTSRLATNGDGSNLTISFNPASTDDPIASGDTLATIAGKTAKGFSDLGDMAYRDTITAEDLSPEIKSAIDKANTALQSYTETDPTVPAWAKEATKPTYTANEVGAIPLSEASKFALKEDIGTVYKYKGTVGSVSDLPSTDNAVGDVWNVEETDMNYGWTGEAWDPLGQPFQIESITNDEIDAIMNASATPAVASVSAKSRKK